MDGARADSAPATAAVCATHKDGVLWLTLNRPARLNAVTAVVLDELCSRLDEARTDPTVRAVVLTGSGRAFCSGADLGGDAEHAGGMNGTLEAAHRVVRALRRLRAPVVAAVNGPAVGVGAGLALSCDLLVAQESAFFLFSFRDIGLMPDGGLSATLPAAVGRVRALEILLLGQRISAEQALAWGMINRVVPTERFADEVRSLAANLAEGPTLAFGYTKMAIDTALRGPLGESLEHEIDGSDVLRDSADHQEGVAAFREGRAPHFRGH